MLPTLDADEPDGTQHRRKYLQDQFFIQGNDEIGAGRETCGAIGESPRLRAISIAAGSHSDVSARQVRKVS
jgi:hypothetical protein